MSDAWTERLKQVVIILTLLISLATTIGTIVNHNKITAVQEHQQVNSDKIDAVKVTADDTQKKVDTVVKMGALK